MEYYKLEGLWGCDDLLCRKWCKDMKEWFDLKFVIKLGYMKIKIIKKKWIDLMFWYILSLVR